MDLNGVTILITGGTGSLGKKLTRKILSRLTLEYDDHFVIQPQFPWWGDERKNGGRQVSDGFTYTSGYNNDVLNAIQIKNIIKEFSDGEQGDLLRAANN